MRWTGWTSCSRTRRSDAGVKHGGQEGDCFGVAVFGGSGHTKAQVRCDACLGFRVVRRHGLEPRTR
jgi:hypothetical protein